MLPTSSLYLNFDGNGKSAAHAKRLGGHLQDRRGLLAFVLAALHQAHHLLDELQGKSVSLSDLLDGTGVLFNIPDDFVPYIKYGVYADMLGKTGRGQDLLRARYSEQRFQEGVVLTKALLEGWD